MSEEGMSWSPSEILRALSAVVAAAKLFGINLTKPEIKPGVGQVPPEQGLKSKILQTDLVDLEQLLQEQTKVLLSPEYDSIEKANYEKRVSIKLLRVIETIGEENFSPVDEYKSLVLYLRRRINH